MATKKQTYKVTSYTEKIKASRETYEKRKEYLATQTLRKQNVKSDNSDAWTPEETSDKGSDVKDPDTPSSDGGGTGYTPSAGGYPVQVSIIADLPKEAYRNGVGKYEGVVAHATATPEADAEAELQYFNREWKSRKAFVHFFVDYDSIIQMASTDYKAWGAGNGNPRFVHVELCEFKEATKFQESYKRYCWLLADILRKQNLGVTDGVTLVSHAWVSKNLGGTNHGDPIDYLKSHGVTWNQMVADVKAAYEDTSRAPVGNAGVKKQEMRVLETEEEPAVLSHGGHGYQEEPVSIRSSLYQPVRLRGEEMILSSKTRQLFLYDRVKWGRETSYAEYQPLDKKRFLHEFHYDGFEGNLYAPDAKSLFESLLLRTKKPYFHIISGFRFSEKGNLSPHEAGCAIDILVKDEDEAREICDHAYLLGFRSIAIGGNLKENRGFIHLDIAPKGTEYSIENIPIYGGPGKWKIP